MSFPPVEKVQGEWFPVIRHLLYTPGASTTHHAPTLLPIETIGTSPVALAQGCQGIQGVIVGLELRVPPRVRGVRMFGRFVTIVHIYPSGIHFPLLHFGSSFIFEMFFSQRLTSVTTSGKMTFDVRSQILRNFINGIPIPFAKSRFGTPVFF